VSFFLYVIPIMLVGITAISAITDIVYGKIKNWLTYPTMVTALILHFSHNPLDGLITLCVMVAIFAAGLPIFFFKLLRGGDLKLIIACSGLLSYPYCFAFILFTMFAGGIVAIIVALRNGNLQKSVGAVGAFASPLMYGAIPTSLPFTTNKIPYGVAIFFGAVATVALMLSPWAMRLL
jgi:prepilin peptidase CpaA